MKFVSHSFVLEKSPTYFMFLSYSFSTLNEYYILFSILFYPKFCQPWIISKQNSKRVSKDRLRKQLLHMKFPYTRYGYELESADAVLSRIRYLRRERLGWLHDRVYRWNLRSYQPHRSVMLTRQHYWTKDTFFYGELLNIKFHMFYYKKIVIIYSFAHENME